MIIPLEYETVFVVFCQRKKTPNGTIAMVTMRLEPATVNTAGEAANNAFIVT